MLLSSLRTSFTARGRTVFRLPTFIGWFMLALITACSPDFDRFNSSQPSAASFSPQPSTLRLGYINSGGSGQSPAGPTGWALQQGILKPELEKVGISEVQVLGFPNGPDLNEALVAGQLDVGIYGDTPALVARAKGIPTRLIAQEQVGMEAWLVGQRDGPRSLADLRGQTIATQKGSYMHRYLMGVLQASGLTDDVTIVHLFARDAQAALDRGELAAYAAPVGTGPLLLSKGYPLIDLASQHTDLTGTSVVVATETFLEKHPDFSETWNQIRSEAVEDIQVDPDAYYQFHADLTGYPIEVIKASYPLSQFSEDPFPDKGLQLLEGTKKFLVSAELAESDFAISDWIRTE
jgi:sulfonate transport system substrate-binding protein